MAYFCLTIIEGSTGLKGNQDARGEAAKRDNVERAILKTLGELTSTKGTGEEARKYDAGATKAPLTQSETNWLEAVVRLLNSAKR